MAARVLKFNPSKTEYISFDSVEQRKVLSALFSIDIHGNKHSDVEKVPNLGVIFGAGFSFQNNPGKCVT